MRCVLLLLLAMVFSSVAEGTPPSGYRTWAPVDLPPPPDQMPWYENLWDFQHSQLPSPYLVTINSSTGFGTEVVDDVPENLYDLCANHWGFYIAEYGGAWQDPAGIIISAYYGSVCPPELAPIRTRYVPWGDIIDDWTEWVLPLAGWKQLVYEEPGCFTCYRVLLELCHDQLHIRHSTSVSIVVDNTWGEDPPYCGVVMTGDHEVFACGEAYWDGDFWAAPRWTPISEAYSGIPVDLAYGVCHCASPTASEVSTWGAVKALYR